MAGGPARDDGARGILPQVIVGCLVAGLICAMAIQPTRQLLAQKARIEQVKDDLHDLKVSNTRLAQHVARLQDPDYIEQRAREQMGLVKPGETTYIVMPPAKSRRGAAHKPAPKTSSKSSSSNDRQRQGALGGFLDFLGV